MLAHVRFGVQQIPCDDSPACGKVVDMLGGVRRAWINSLGPRVASRPVRFGRPGLLDCGPEPDPGSCPVGPPTPLPRRIAAPPRRDPPPAATRGRPSRLRFATAAFRAADAFRRLCGRSCCRRRI